MIRTFRATALAAIFSIWAAPSFAADDISTGAWLLPAAATTYAAFTSQQPNSSPA